MADPPTPPSPAPPVIEGLRGARVAVTGSTSGIGAATAEMLAAAGADVIVHGYRSAERAAAVARKCQAHGVRAAWLLADVSDAAARTDLVERAWSQWGGLDSWVHCAGADILTGPYSDLPFPEKLELLWRVDVESMVLVCRDIGRRLCAADGGSIVTIGWDQAETGMDRDTGQLFGTTKAAVMAFTRSLAVELAPTVRVNCVAPGWIRTSWAEGASGYWNDRAVSEAPLARWGTPDDVAAAIRFLVSPESDFVTGQVLRVGGGAVR